MVWTNSDKWTDGWSDSNILPPPRWGGGAQYWYQHPNICWSNHMPINTQTCWSICTPINTDMLVNSHTYQHWFAGQFTHLLTLTCWSICTPINTLTCWSIHTPINTDMLVNSHTWHLVNSHTHQHWHAGSFTFLSTLTCWSIHTYKHWHAGHFMHLSTPTCWSIHTLTCWSIHTPINTVMLVNSYTYQHWQLVNSHTYQHWHWHKHLLTSWSIQTSINNLTCWLIHTPIYVCALTVQLACSSPDRSMHWLSHGL